MLVRVLTAGALQLGTILRPATPPTTSISSARELVAAPVASFSARALSDSITEPAPADTIRRRPKPVAVEYSDWYGRRLTIHRWASYLTLPLFAANYVTGTRLLEDGNRAPAWAINSHGPLAATVTGLFGVNTFTGGWNLIEARKDPAGRGWRTTHAVLMLAADAGFATAGILSDQAERSDQRRRLHRAVAIGSMSTAVFSYLMMLPPFRHD